MCVGLNYIMLQNKHDGLGAARAEIELLNGGASGVVMSLVQLYLSVLLKLLLPVELETFRYFFTSLYVSCDTSLYVLSFGV